MGPLDEEGMPDKAHKGETFKAWMKMIESLGYNVGHRVLCCADYGDATSRRRFFLIAVRRDVGVPAWPEPTHGDHVPGLPQWRGAGECLDLSNLGKSIFGRKRPLAEKTLARLADGARKYWGLDLTTGMLVKACGGRRMKPFIVKLNRGATTEDVDDPLTTVTSGGNHHALVQAKPFIAKMRHNATHAGVDEPLTTVSAGGGHHALCQLVATEGRFLLNNNEHNVPKTLDRPVPTLTTGNHAYMCSLVCDHQNHGRAEPLDRPLKTQPTHDRSSLVTLVLGQHGAAACRTADDPVPTVACKGAVRTFEPIVIDNANGGTLRGSREPLNTATPEDRHMMALPVLEDGRRIDILMRMLTPRELARAHSVPDDFVITGNKTEQTKQVRTLLERYAK